MTCVDKKIQIKYNVHGWGINVTSGWSRRRRNYARKISLKPSDTDEKIPRNLVVHKEQLTSTLFPPWGQQQMFADGMKRVNWALRAEELLSVRTHEVTVWVYFTGNHVSTSSWCLSVLSVLASICSHVSTQTHTDTIITTHSSIWQNS